MIPFKKENKEAIEAFKGLSKGRPLMPSNFNNEKNIEKIKGVYIPFWLYDLDVSGTVNMNANVVTTWTRGRTHYTKTDTYNVNRGGSMKFNNIPVDASTRFENDIMNSIEPFNFQELIPYNHAYLSGFYAEKYDEEGEKFGTITVTETADGISIEVKASGLKPGQVGFHLHEKNSPEPTTDANGNLVVGGGLGGHWDPDNTQKHAGPDGDGHRGDLDALTINDDGSINQVVISAKIKYGDVKGRSFVIHANPDNYTDEPANGGSGAPDTRCRA